MTFDGAKRAKGFWRRKIWIISLTGFLISSAIAWTIFWQIATNAMNRMLNTWMDQEARAGHKWTCLEKNISGYPFKIEINCANPRFEGEISGKPQHGTLAGFHAFASLFQPHEIDALFQAPFTAQSEAGDFSFRLDWSLLEVKLRGNPDSLQNLTLEARDPNLEGTFADLGPVAGKAKNLALLFTKLTERSDHAFAFDLTLMNGTSLQLEPMLGSALPADLTIKGAISAFDLSGGGDAIQRIEAWRSSGGHIDFDRAELVQSRLKLAANGQLGLDSAHRIDGKLQAQLTGFGPLLRRFGINPALLDAASLIGALTGKSHSGSGSETGSLKVPLTFSNGVLSIGPLRTPLALRPLY